MKTTVEVERSFPDNFFGMTRSSFWSNVPSGNQIILLRIYEHRAARILQDNGITVPSSHQLQLIVAAALEAVVLFFGAAAYDLTTRHTEKFFEDFVVRCAVEES